MRAAAARRTRSRRAARTRPQLGARSPAAVLTESVWPLFALAALSCLVALLGMTFGPDSLDRVVVGMVINLIVVVGLYIFVGISGVFSFGHAAFMAIGAYAGAILVIPPETKPFILPDLPGFLTGVRWDALPATIAAGGLAAAVALVLAVPLVRLSGLTAGLATFAVLIVVNVVAKNWQQVTHGTAGIAGIPTTTTITAALGWALVAMTVAWAFQRWAWACACAPLATMRPRPARSASASIVSGPSPSSSRRSSSARPGRSTGCSSGRSTRTPSSSASPS